jgi:dipeptidyl aminopeptidase/acylaminoacyl peptidase
MRAIRSGLALLLLSASAGSAVSAQNGQTLADKFGALETVRQISLSPDGAHVAFIAPRAGTGQTLFVADVVNGGLPKAVVNSSNENEELNWCAWATDVRLICQVRILVNDAGVLVGFSRMIALDSDGKNFAKLTVGTNSRSLGFIQDGGAVIDWDVAGKPGSVLMTRAYVPENETGTHIVNSDQGLGVELVDTGSLKRQQIERPKRTAVEYISDGHGLVRVMGLQDRDSDTGVVSPEIKYLYRRPDSRNWEPLSVLKILGGGQYDGFNPIAVDSTSNRVFGYDAENGYQGIYAIALDGSNTRTRLLGRSDVDIDQLERIGRDNRVVGASYATERRTVEFFDPELKALAAALTKALPGNPQITFVDASVGEAKLLLVASSDTNPGMLYLYSKATKRLEEVLPVRAALEGMAMGKMTPVSFPAADGTMIPGYLTLPPGSTGKGLPAIVMPHGGPGSRDEWGFDWLVQYYAARGFAVLQPNYRGSTGYGAAWYQKNGFQSWRVAIGDVNDAGRWLVSQGIAKPDQLGIVGWSYGGYAALQSSVLDPNLFKAIVAVAPVTDLERLRDEARPYTSFAMVDRFIGRGPHVREGSPAQNAAAIKAPVLMFHGSMDQNVGIGESRLMADKLRAAGKQVELVEFPGLNHSLVDRAARVRLLADSDAFLRRSMGIPAN